MGVFICVSVNVVVKVRVEIFYERKFMPKSDSQAGMATEATRQRQAAAHIHMQACNCTHIYVFVCV